MELRRGAVKSKRNRGVNQWPQQVRVEWDRGKVDVAVSVTPPPRARFDSDPAKLGKKEKALVERMLFAVAQSLELLLARGVAPAEARAGLDRLDRELEDQARRARRRQTITLIVVLVFVVAAVGFAIYAAVSSSPRYR